MKTQKKRSPGRKQGIIAAAVFCGIFLVVLFFLLFFPRVLAESRFSSRMKTITEKEVESLLLTDPRRNESDILSGGREVYLEGEEAKKLAKDFSDLLASRKYLGAVKAESGDWNIRIRVETTEGNVTFYLGTESVYYSQNQIQYHFAPSDGQGMEEYTAFYQRIETLLDAPDGT